MQTLSFIVDGQILEKDPKCDFSGLIPGSDNYLKAKFTFSSEWNGLLKVIGIWSRLGAEYPPQVLENDGTFLIPAEVLESKYFKIQVIGKRKGDTFKLTTNKLEICQNGG